MIFPREWVDRKKKEERSPEYFNSKKSGWRQGGRSLRRSNQWDKGKISSVKF
jgi:hypothetical protein